MSVRTDRVLTLEDVCSLVIFDGCNDSSPCSHYSRITLYDGRSKDFGNCDLIGPLIANIAKEKINPHGHGFVDEEAKTFWMRRLHLKEEDLAGSADRLIEHFKYKNEKTPEAVLKELFPEDLDNEQLLLTSRN